MKNRLLTLAYWLLVLSWIATGITVAYFIWGFFMAPDIVSGTDGLTPYQELIGR